MNTTTVLLGLALGLAVAGVVAWKRRHRAFGPFLDILAVATLAWGAYAADWWVRVLLVLAAAVVASVVWLRWHGTANVVNRWGARARRTSGVATTLDIARFASGPAMRRKATTVRPSLQELSRTERARTRTTEVAIPLARVGAQRVWSSVEDVTVVFGGPRTGKTGWLAGRVIDAPGALLVTSTRTDLHDLTFRLREKRGPVHVFNAVGLGGLPSTITFDPLTGCCDPVAAAERATDMIAAGQSSGGGDREYWDGQGRRVLASLLHAAALGGLTMRDVHAWVSDPVGAKRQIISLLRRSPAKVFEQDAEQFVETNPGTRTSITSTIMPALGWLTSPAASAAATAGPVPFDVAQLLQSRATVYLLGAEETQSAPLVCALTGHIAREARRLAALMPVGRLDPPLTLALDEAARISPVPLDSWTADMGGAGVCLICAFQSRAQVVQRWGATGSAIILNNAASIMMFGGTRDKDDLEYWSTLAGTREQTQETRDKDGRVTSRTTREVPVITPSKIGNLPQGQAVVYRRGMPPVVGRVQMAWKRRDVRGLARTDRRVAKAAAKVARRAGAGGFQVPESAA